MVGNQLIKTAYYVAAIAFHLVLLLTNAGNYFHVGTPVELVAMQGIAVVISMVAIKLFQKVGTIEKVFVVLCALVPLFFVIVSVLSAVRFCSRGFLSNQFFTTFAPIQDANRERKRFSECPCATLQRPPLGRAEIPMHT